MPALPQLACLPSLQGVSLALLVVLDLLVGVAPALVPRTELSILLGLHIAASDDVQLVGIGGGGDGTALMDNVQLSPGGIGLRGGQLGRHLRSADFTLLMAKLV